MQPSACSPNRVLLVHIIWQGDVDRIDVPTREELIDIAVVAQSLHAIAAAQLPQLLLLAGDQGRQHAVAAGMPEGR